MEAMGFERVQRRAEGGKDLFILLLFENLHDCLSQYLYCSEKQEHFKEVKRNFKSVMPQQPASDMDRGKDWAAAGQRQELLACSSNHFTHWELNGKHVRSLPCSLEQENIPEWIKQELSR